MLGKIIKHEFRATWKKICGMYAIMIASLIIGIISYNAKDADLGDFTSDIASIVSVISMTVLIMSMTAASVIIFVILCQRFYQSIYSNQGYLTMTLPVSKINILNGKLITYLIWAIATILVIVPCAWSYICFIDGRNEFWDIFEFIGEYIYNCDDILYEFILPIINMLLMIIRVFLYIFACLSLGQLSNNHKIGMAVVWSFLLRIAESFVSAFISYFFTQSNGPYSLMLFMFKSTFANTMRTISIFSLVISLIIGGIYYVITLLIMSKKVNLQ